MGVTKFAQWDPATVANPQTKAGDYISAANSRSVELYNEQFAASWYPLQDTSGKWTTPFFGAPYSVGGVQVEETPALASLRAEAEIVDGPIYWPEE
jgi:hypothetical protein